MQSMAEIAHETARYSSGEKSNGSLREISLRGKRLFVRKLQYPTNQESINSCDVCLDMWCLVITCQQQNRANTKAEAIHTRTCALNWDEKHATTILRQKIGCQ